MKPVAAEERWYLNNIYNSRLHVPRLMVGSGGLGITMNSLKSKEWGLNDLLTSSKILEIL